MKKYISTFLCLMFFGCNWEIVDPVQDLCDEINLCEGTDNRCSNPYIDEDFSCRDAYRDLARCRLMYGECNDGWWNDDSFFCDDEYDEFWYSCY